MKDRIPTYPGRVEVTHEDGTKEFVTVKRADEPTQEGTALNKGTLLDDVTQMVIGLGDSEATVNMALRRIMLPAGKYAALVTLLTPGGRPIPNTAISGISSAAGTACITDANGKALGYTTTATAVISASPDFIDANNVSKTVSFIKDGIVQINLQLTRASITSKVYSTSDSFLFSPDVSSFDCSAIGGGGKGGDNYKQGGSFAYAGFGGGSGQTANRGSIPAPNTRTYITIGAANGTTKVGNYLSASGGSNGSYTSAGTGGARGGSGAYATTSAGKSTVHREATSGGNQSTPFLYPPTSVGGAGGGGAVQHDTFATTSRGSGGEPGGGDGGYNSNGGNGELPGSGGGGAYASLMSGSLGTDATGGAGSPGLAGIAWRYK